MTRAALIRQCVMLVGGRGTRLGALAGDLPKPMLPVGGRPFLGWIMREMVRFGVTDFLLLTGHLSDRIEAAVEALAATLPKPVSIALSKEPAEAGTGGALHHAADRLQERFLLCNGDSLFACNLAPVLAAAAADDAPVRMTLRRVDDASRFGVVEVSGERVTSFRERPQAGTPGIINAGVYVCDRGLLSRLRRTCSLERDVLPGLAAAGGLRGTMADGYFRDIGIPADLAAARQELPGRIRRPALFLDRDGVLNVDHGWVGTRERFEWIPGAREAVAAATAAGRHVFVVTNQSGVARGHYDEAAVAALHGWMAEEILRSGGTIDDLRYCPFHPEGALSAYRRASDWRKPEPGMLLDLIRAWDLTPGDCVMIGDKAIDMAAAAAAGMSGHLFEGGNLAEFLAGILR